MPNKALERGGQRHFLEAFSVFLQAHYKYPIQKCLFFKYLEICIVCIGNMYRVSSFRKRSVQQSCKPILHSHVCNQHKSDGHSYFIHPCISQMADPA